MNNNNAERKDRRRFNRYFNSLYDHDGEKYRRGNSVFELAWTYKALIINRRAETPFNEYTIKTNSIILDIDVDNDDLGLNEKLEQAKEDTIKIIEYLKENHNLKTYETWYSGKKGFHILIPFGEYFITSPYLIDGKSRPKHIVLEYANLLTEISTKTGVKSLDSAIGEIKRIIQLPNVKKEKDKDRGYKICVDIENNSIDEIREASKDNKNLAKPVVELRYNKIEDRYRDEDGHQNILYDEGTNKDFLTWFKGLTQAPKPTKEAQKKTGKTGAVNKKNKSNYTATNPASVTANELKEDYHRVTEIIKPYYEHTHNTAPLIARLAKTAGVTDIKTFAQPFAQHSKKNYVNSIMDAYDTEEALDYPKAYLMELTNNMTGEPITEEEVNEVLELFGITDTPQIANDEKPSVLIYDYAMGQLRGQLVQYDYGLYFLYRNKKTKDLDVKLIGNIVIKELTVTYDKVQNNDLELFKPEVTLKYLNTAINEEKTIKNKSFEEINKILYADHLIKKNEQGIKTLLNDIYVECVCRKDLPEYMSIKAEKDLLRDGFFMVNGKLITNDEFENIKITPEKMKEAGEILNDIIKDRGEATKHDCTVLRFMLSAPFSYALKQQGLENSLKNLVLYGQSGANKTGACLNGAYFYANDKYKTEDTLSNVKTQAALGTELEKSTFPCAIDESEDILNNANNEVMIKDTPRKKKSRSVTKQSNYRENEDYHALRSIIYSQNATPIYLGKDEFHNRHIILKYTKDMVLSDKAKEEFKAEFEPTYPKTSKLRGLIYIGKAFYDKIKPMIENRDKKLYNIHEATKNILSAINEEYDLNLNKKFFEDPDEHREEFINADKIRNGLNKIFRKAHKPINYQSGKYVEQDFINCALQGELNWLHYQKTKNVFVISGKWLADEIEGILTYSMDIQDILKELELETKLETIKFKHKAQKNCFRIDVKQLAFKILNISIYENDED